MEIVKRLSSKKFSGPRWVYNNVDAGVEAYKAGAEKALNAYCKAMISSSSSRGGKGRGAAGSGGGKKLKKKKVNVKDFLEKKFLQKCRTDKICFFGKDEKNKTKFDLMVECSKKIYERKKRDEEQKQKQQQGSSSSAGAAAMMHKQNKDDEEDRN